MAILVLGGAGCVSKNNPIKSVDSIDNRIVLKPITVTEGMDSYDVPSDKTVCSQILKFDPANEQKVYSNINKGIKISLPYNSTWGNERFKISAYDESVQKVEFGPLNKDLLDSAKQNCEWQRLSKLTFEPARTVEKAVEVIKSYGKVVALQPTSYSVNGLNVIKYRSLLAKNDLSRGWCVLEIVGKKANYRLYTICSDDANKEFDQLEDIAKTAAITE